MDYPMFNKRKLPPLPKGNLAKRVDAACDHSERDGVRYPRPDFGAQQYIDALHAHRPTVIVTPGRRRSTEKSAWALGHANCRRARRPQDAFKRRPALRQSN